MNKDFNTYKEGLDLEFLREYCMEHGERRVMERGCFKYMVHRSATKETLGSSKNDEEGRSATKETLATNGTQEGLLHGLRLRGRVLRQAKRQSRARVRLPLLPRRRRVGGEHRGGHAVRGARHQRTRAAGAVRQRPEDGEDGREDPEALELVRLLPTGRKNLFKMVYGRDLDHYRYTARSRYRRLLERCPQVVQMLSLKDITSFLNVTPVYLSKIRKEITFG